MTSTDISPQGLAMREGIRSDVSKRITESLRVYIPEAQLETLLDHIMSDVLMHLHDYNTGKGRPFRRRTLTETVIVS